VRRKRPGSHDGAAEPRELGWWGAAVLEASRNWTVMYDLLEELVREVHLAHPLKVKAIQDGQVLLPVSNVQLPLIAKKH
jgi:hypothetical protein